MAPTSRVGVPQHEEAPIGFASLFGRNITLTGGRAPVRAYIEELTAITVAPAVVSRWRSRSGSRRVAGELPGPPRSDRSEVSANGIGESLLQRR
jgi:hypothetical protein